MQRLKIVSLICLLGMVVPIVAEEQSFSWFGGLYDLMTDKKSPLSVWQRTKLLVHGVPQACYDTRAKTDCLKDKINKQHQLTALESQQLDECVHLHPAFYFWQKRLTDLERWERLANDPHSLEWNGNGGQTCNNLLKKIKSRSARKVCA